MEQAIVVATSLILGGAGFVYSAIPNPKPHSMVARVIKLLLGCLSSSHAIPSLLDIVIALYQQR